MKPIIRLVIGDITKQNDCDGVVNSANQNLRAGSGVCGAIYGGAGPELETCSVQFAPLGLGQAIVTPGFLLPNRWIIHVRGPKYHIDPEPASNLARAMENVLRVAEENGIRKIAVPAISMGIYAYPPEEAVPILVDATFRALPGLRVLEEIRFVVLKTKLATLFQLVIADAEKRFGDLKRASALKHWGVE